MTRTPHTMRSRCLALAWISLAGVMLYPLVWAFLSSLKASNVEIFEHPFALPAALTWSNFSRAVREGQMAAYFVNSIWVTGLSTAATVLFGVWAGHGLSKTAFPLRRLWLAAFLTGMVLPVQAYLIPLVDLLNVLGVHDSLWALILPYTAQNLPLAVLFFAGYFQSLPSELEDAARMDGAGSWTFYFDILMPAARPAIATIVVLSCLNGWNEFLMAMLFVVDPEARTLPVGMMAFEQSHNTDYAALLAGLTLISLPTLALYAVFNKQIIRGVTAGTIK